MKNVKRVHATCCMFWDSIPDRQEIFLFKMYRPAVGPAKPAIHWVPGLGRLGHESDRKPPPSAEFKNG